MVFDQAQGVPEKPTSSRARGSVAYVFMLTLVAALGGLLFGYDTAVISGAIGFLQAHFDLDPQLWKGWAAASALIGCAFGAALAGMASDHLGRKKVLVLSAVLFLISALGTAFPRTFAEFVLYRILGGLGVGAASMTSPMYIAEISPARIRGRMVSVNQFAIVTGMLIVYFVNYFIGGYGTAVDRAAVEPAVARWGTTIDPHRAAAFLRQNATRSPLVDANDPASVEAFEREIESLLAAHPDGLEASAVAGFLHRYDVNVSETEVHLAAEGLVPWNVARGWRWMFGSEALPATLLLLLLFFVPESPRWLTKQGRRDQAFSILARVDGPDNARVELAAIEDAIARETGSILQMFMPGFRVVLVIGVVLAVLQQITGINVFLYYAPDIFKKMGTESDVALLQTVIVGAVMLTFTIVAIWTVDRLGRKPLMLIGYAGMGISLVAWGLILYCRITERWVLAFVLGYIACFALSVGPVTWVILSEIFPTRIRGRAMAIATVSLWIANFLVTQTFTIMDEQPALVARFHHGFPYWVYALFCAVAVVFMIACVPETKGKTLEQIERDWMRSSAPS